MTDCPNGEIGDQLPELLHGHMAPAQRALAQAHLATCAECRAELALLEVMRDSLQPTAAADVSAIVGALPPYGAAPGRRWGSWRAAAAIAAIAIGGASLVIATRDAGTDGTRGSTTAAASATLDSTQAVRAAPGAQVTSQGTAVGTPRAAPAAPRELAMEHGFGELSDRELAALLEEIESLDALPVVDVESVPLVPASALTSTGGAT